MQLDHADKRSSATQRLPVNPRRHKVAPEQRKRVATACNSCNVRRVKCSGGNPCGQCSASSRECVYPVPVEKVSLTRTELEDLKKTLVIYEKALQEAIPDPARRQELINHISATPDGSSPSPSPFSAGPSFPSKQIQLPGAPTVKPEPDNEQTAGRLLQDPEGTARFLGETSGATFLDHLKELLGAVLPLARVEPQLSQDRDGTAFLSDLGRYYTDDSRPLTERDTEPISLPIGDVLGGMLAKLRHLIQDGNGEWPSGGIYWWGEFNTAPAHIVSPPPNASDSELHEYYRPMAFFHAALAVITQANSTSHEMQGIAATPTLSESYFSRAATLVGNPLDITRCCTISDVATLCLMAYYLIEMNRRDAAYMHVAAAMHICIMLGVHRGLVDERGKRVFWTAYIMDRWLSCLMGRPHIIMDDAIRIQLPADAPSMPPAAGLRANVELSRISGYVVCNTYRVAPWESARGEAFRQPDKAIWMLQQWQSTLPPRLQLSPDGLSNDPACCLLHMRYNMLLVLAIRPMFLAAVKKSVARRLMVRSVDTDAQSEHLKLCIAAARRNIRLGRHMATANISRTAPLHAEQHFIFNATVCLILEDLISDEEISAEELEARNQDISFGIEKEEENLAYIGKTSLNTLHHLWVLARRLTAPPNHDFGATRLAEPQMTAPMMVMTPEHTLPRMQIEEDHALYDELVAWVNDEWPRYNANMFNGTVP